MKNNNKAFLLGLFLLLGVLGTLSLTIFFKPTLRNVNKLIKVRCADVEGVSLGTQVTRGGRVIGKVVKIISIDDTESLVNASDRRYVYELWLKIKSPIKIFYGDRIVVSSLKIIGEKTVNILPSISTNTKEYSLKDVSNQILYAENCDFIKSFEAFNSIVKDLALKIESNIDSFINSFSSLAVSSEKFVKKIDENQLIEKISSLVENTNYAVVQCSDFCEKGALSEINTLLVNLIKGTDQCSYFIETLQELFNSDTQSIKSSLITMEEILEDIKNHGWFFYNKKKSNSKNKNLIVKKNSE